MEIEDLNEDSTESDDESDEEVPTNISYNADIDTEPFQEWLQAYRPSTIDCETSGAQWIFVTGKTKKEWINYYGKRDVEGLVNAWFKVLKSKRHIDFRLLFELASNHHVTSGKWIFYQKSGPKIDILWEKVANGIIDGDSAIFHTAKVSTRSEDNQQQVVCIYNTDFRDKARVMELEHAIRNTGIKCTLIYKADVFTYVGVYGKNQWGLRPFILETMFDVKAGHSVITHTAEEYETLQ